MLQVLWFFGTWSILQQLSSTQGTVPSPIVVATYFLGDLGRRQGEVKFICNNESVVAVLSSGTSRDPNLMVLLFYWRCWQFTIHFLLRLL